MVPLVTCAIPMGPRATVLGVRPSQGSPCSAGCRGRGIAAPGAVGPGVTTGSPRGTLSVCCPRPELAARTARSPGRVFRARREQPCPGPAPPGLQTHQLPLPFPPNQPAEGFINLRKRDSKQKEPNAEPKFDLSNLPSLSSPGARYYLSAFAESPPSGTHQALPEERGLATACVPLTTPLSLPFPAPLPSAAEG